MIYILQDGRRLLEQIATFESAVQLLGLRKEVADSILDKFQLQNLVHIDPILWINL